MEEYMSNHKEMFNDAIRDTLSELYCIHHIDVELETTEVTSTQKVPWSDEPLFTNIKRSKYAKQ